MPVCLDAHSYSPLSIAIPKFKIMSLALEVIIDTRHTSSSSWLCAHNDHLETTGACLQIYGELYELFLPLPATDTKERGSKVSFPVLNTYSFDITFIFKF